MIASSEQARLADNRALRRDLMKVLRAHDVKGVTVVNSKQRVTLHVAGKGSLDLR